MTPQKIRSQIEECRGDLARAEGQATALAEEGKTTMGKLRDLLGCKPGGEKRAIKKLREMLTADEAELDRLLDQVQALRDGDEEEEDDS